ncbi:TraR/DksA family transcriptional regulator [Caldithrix abyssi]|uniref:RNA polymerase-binding protein DksA n=1 Tax=Caldithrix abyssi DSM 13497 TaxID=880073 RepID=H1XQZ8_CALAY|nr:TraR/DksA family transcriptional regulator [Caldithrix abyssi]APF20010.1 RNA polymerase-binding protein DksA [Caldithrix abyssi DSM 13497]EHO40092.1 transcriptional regulator, TraR/DksA family [Caldithrix abyssi DSM 13497]
MDAKKLQEFKEILLKKRKETLEERERYGEILQDTNSEEDYGKTAYKYTEFGTDTMNREQSYMFLARMDKFLNQIDQALERIENGTYGVCRVCGQEIDEKRLRAVPTTRICFDCKQKESRAVR